VDQPALLELFARAESLPRLPRLGGMARPNGVVILSERFWAFAGVDGSLREGEMAQGPSALRRVPLVRGLLRLGSAISPIVRRDGVVRAGERRFLIAVLLAPFALFLLPSQLQLVVGVLLSVAMVAWLMRGRTLRLHGAEHRAIAAVEQRKVLSTWSGEARPSRFAARCGTNFAALVLPVAALFDSILWSLPAAAVALLALSLTMELWVAIEGRTHRFARAFLVPGLLLQRLTTREPRLDETQLALRAAASVLRRELAQPS
jgi:uncharacterized protein YqhQ